MQDAADMKSEEHNLVTGTLIFYLLVTIWLNKQVFVE